MRSLLLSLFFAGAASADIKPAAFDLGAIRDSTTLETKVIQDWQSVATIKGVKQKLVEITVCEWWPGQKVRLPVTFCVPDSNQPCTNVIIGNMGLALKPAQPSGAMLKLLTENGVGIVLIGMSTIDSMEPKGTLHLGMKNHLLKEKDARYTPAWIWGMSDMRALTAAMAESGAFDPKKVLATGGSKRGVGAAICGIHDDRFTAVLPVVAPILDNPGGAYVRGSTLQEEAAINAVFLQHLPPGPNPLGLPDTARQALIDREQNRANQSISKDDAVAAGWSDEEIARMNDAAWEACLTAKHLETVRKRGLEFFYHVGTNDNVCPSLRRLGELVPDFPLYILPGGQHGGPRSSGFTLQTPSQKEAEENLFAFARHHFFRDRSLPAAARLEMLAANGSHKLKVIVTVPGSLNVQRNIVSWCFDRHPPYTFAMEYDHWNSAQLVPDVDGAFSAEIVVPASATTVDVVSTHTHEENGLPFHFSSAYRRWSR
jgi:hypothetical protein